MILLATNIMEDNLASTSRCDLRTFEVSIISVFLTCSRRPGARQTEYHSSQQPVHPVIVTQCWQTMHQRLIHSQHDWNFNRLALTVGSMSQLHSLGGMYAAPSGPVSCTIYSEDSTLTQIIVEGCCSSVGTNPACNAHTQMQWLSTPC